MGLPHFIVLLLILFSTTALCMLIDYWDVDRRAIQRGDTSNVISLPHREEEATTEHKRAA